ncbi:hypothetical protein AB1286_04200 [Trinickia sp. NRRL B-1857]|uniref:hypothetical protein n=1 Tax=Trinickia sp. NRRL B-1857 TaxID=3162879 RepID=UPI003D274775
MASPADILSFSAVARPVLDAGRRVRRRRPLKRQPQKRSGAIMDLAMAMGLSLFGIFAGSTVFFFYRLPR